MKRVLLLFTLLAGLSYSTFAQKSDPGKFSIGVEAGLPMGDASNISTVTIGGSFKYEQPIIKKLAVTLSAGYTYFPYKGDVKVDIAVLAPSNNGEGFVPIKAGLKYWICSSFYAEGQAGVSLSTNNNGTYFAYAPGIGVKVSNAADLGLRYEAWTKDGSTLGQLAVRIAYSF